MPPESGDRSMDPPPPTAGRPSPTKKMATSTVVPKAAAPGDLVAREKPEIASTHGREAGGKWRRSWPGRCPPPAPPACCGEDPAEGKGLPLLAVAQRSGRRRPSPNPTGRSERRGIPVAVPARQQGEAAAAATPRGLCPEALPAAAAAALPDEAKELDKKLCQITKDKNEALRGQDFEKAGKLRDEEMEMKARSSNY
ncbi:hypothetical protein QYE76_002818 [Lolium multiflorum]|uniref:UVR domain-containing protein n=1 Tax=Lolium multiflorum TaxID=4521 RepID=A0AAD8W0P0_LOLMU|nr:hypothetical protein QYE76_002818 [Lolium multiflorum]